MNRKLKIFSWLLVITIVPSMVYYSSKFYIEKSLNFTANCLLGWTIIVSLIILSVILNLVVVKIRNKIYNKLIKTQDQNEELKQLIKTLISQAENNHFEDVGYQQGTREIVLDLIDERG